MSERTTRVVVCLAFGLVIALVAMYSACTHAMNVGRKGQNQAVSIPRVVTVSNALALAPAAGSSLKLNIGILRSELTVDSMGWRGQWGLLGAQACLARLGHKTEIVNLETLEAGAWQGELLILPDVRLMSETTIEAVEQYVANGGRVVATYQTSYRDENNRARQPANFALAELFGADMFRWSGHTTGDSYLEAQVAGKKLSVQLGDPQAMLVRPRAGTEVLARWSGADAEPAILRHGQVLYIAAPIFSPENSSSAQVCDLLGVVLSNFLAESGIAQSQPAFARAAGDDGATKRVAPEMDVEPAGGGGRLVRVGLAQTAVDALLCAPAGKFLRYEDSVSGNSGQMPELRVRAIATVGEEPQLALYDSTGHIVVRTTGSLSINSAQLQSPGAAGDDPETAQAGGNDWLELLYLNGNGTYKWTAYRGSMLLQAAQDRVRFINTLPLESYLQGVVPNEMPAYFHEVALASMACVARSYTLAHIGRHQSQGFDLCSSVHCHDYQGLASESSKVNRAIADTTGSVLMYDGRIVDATYHAVCGGFSDTPDAVWKGASAAPYFVAAPDSAASEGWGSTEEDFRNFIGSNTIGAFCENASKYRWQETYSLQEFSAKLRQSLPVLLGVNAQQVGQVTQVSVLKRTAGGRVANLQLVTDSGTFNVGGDAVRWITSAGKIGPAGLRSSLFYIMIDGDNVVIVGGGWGHGIGLCQEGACGRALDGYSCQEIISHYYPGAELKDYDSAQ